jgi:hypothetical protein
MLVYANAFELSNDTDPTTVIALIARWIGKNAKASVDPERLEEGVREYRMPNSWRLSSACSRNTESEVGSHYSFCVRLSHPDSTVSGRRWITEIGLQKETSDSDLLCSVLLRTDEISARVSSAIQVTRPRIVQDILQACTVSGNVPRLNPTRISVSDAKHFLYDIEHPERKFPIVLMSHGENGLAVAPRRVNSVVAGLAKVVEVSNDADTYRFEDIVGRRFSAFGGAINIIFPARQGREGLFIHSVLLRPEELEKISHEGRSIESEILSAITHQTNLPNSWRHVSIEDVRRRSLRENILKLQTESAGTEDVSGYITLLEDALEDITAKEAINEELNYELEETRAELSELESKAAALEHALGGQRPRGEKDEATVAKSMKPLRSAISNFLLGKYTLEHVLDLIEVLFPDRVVVLDEAKSSARYSDKAGFSDLSVAAELLLKLCDDYWMSLAEGGGDSQARGVFGHKRYSAKESSTLSSEGKKRRTFEYRGKQVFMEKHLRYGVKDSAAKTLRIHFEWLDAERRIVIGHCGKHLDF